MNSVDLMHQIEFDDETLSVCIDIEAMMYLAGQWKVGVNTIPMEILNRISHNDSEVYYEVIFHSIQWVKKKPKYSNFKSLLKRSFRPTSIILFASELYKSAFIDPEAKDTAAQTGETAEPGEDESDGDEKNS